LWCPSVNSFKFQTCVHTTPGGECLRHFCSKRVPKACLTPNKCPTEYSTRTNKGSQVKPVDLVLTSHQMSAKLRKSSVNIRKCYTLQICPENTTNRRAYSEEQATSPNLQVEGKSFNAIESPSFDVINGTTRVSDPL